MSNAGFNWQDPFLLDSQLTEDERMVREAAAAYCQDKLAPRVLDAFRNVRWSTPDALADCIAGLAGHRVARVATLRDVDDFDDLIQLGRAVGRQILPFSQNRQK